jgi:DNA repair photolyase
MTVEITQTTIKNILTRTTGYLRTVTSHSLQPYRGCTFGNSLCGVGCYVQHSAHLTRGRRWGGFLEARTNAAESYLDNYDRESRWARQHRDGVRDDGATGDDVRPRFSIFCSSATDPFLPQEFRLGVTQRVLKAMIEKPPDELVLQTHSHRVADFSDLLAALDDRCRLRVHVSIETDRAGLPGLPPHACPIERRFAACRRLRDLGLDTVVTVSPLLPIDDPVRFFDRVADAARAVVIDHFIGGDGSADGSRTLRTGLPEAMRAVCPESASLEYRERMIEIARQALPGRVGVGIDGFAGRYA